MTTQFQDECDVKQDVRQLIDCTTLRDVFISLYERWQEEKDNEELSDYGSVLTSNINVFSKTTYKLLTTTEQPFGVVVSCGGLTVRFFLEEKDGLLYLVART